MRNLSLIRIVVLLCLAIGLLALAVPCSSPAYGQSAKKQMERNRQKRDKLYDRIKSLGAQQQSLLEGLEVVDSRMDQKAGEVKSIQQQFEAANEKYQTLTREKSELEADLVSRKDGLAKRVRAIYMQGDLSYIDVLFQAASFNELVDRMFFVQAILEQDQRMVSSAKTTRQELSSKLAAIENQILAIESISQRLKAELGALESIKGEKQLDMEAIEKDKALALRQIQELEAENNRLKDELRNLSRSASGYKGKPWSGSFNKPCPGEITSGFGRRKHPIFGVTRMHTGVDISAPEGTTIKAAGKGKVIFSGWRKGYGKCVIVDHGSDRTTLYAHMSRISCDAGQEVESGTKIGEVGSTGWSTGNHCHFEVRINGEPVDPLKELK